MMELLENRPPLKRKRAAIARSIVRWQISDEITSMISFDKLRFSLSDNWLEFDGFNSILD
jgi:hypothetical protein